MAATTTTTETVTNALNNQAVIDHYKRLARDEAVANQRRVSDWKAEKKKADQAAADQADLLNGANPAPRRNDLEKDTVYVVKYQDETANKERTAKLYVDNAGNIRLTNVPKDEAERMSLYREVMRTYKLKLGAYRLILDFPKLQKDDDLKLAEVLKILEIAAAEKVEITPSQRLKDWAANLKAGDKAQFDRAVAATKTSFETLDKPPAAAPAAGANPPAGHPANPPAVPANAPAVPTAPAQQAQAPANAAQDSDSDDSEIDDPGIAPAPGTP